jgi:iron complex outermembrane receptor protein
MLRRFALITTSALVLTGTVNAQQTAATPDSGGLEEITVTAQRRTENIQNVPVAVTAFSAKELEADQITSTLDIARVVPNFIAQNNVGQGSANSYYIRALGQTQSFPTFEPQVGTYIDDIYIGRQNANNFALFDVSQLQVLRGPQGTLFGRNSTGGAVVVTLNKPYEEFGGYIEAGYGKYDRFFGRGSVDIPISPSVLTKTSFYGITDNGYVHDLTTNQELNYTHNWGVREAVRVLPPGMDNITWDLSADYSDSDSANVLNYLDGNGDRISYSGYSTGGGALLPYLSGLKATKGQGVDVLSWGAMSNIAVTTDAGTLNVISGFRGIHQSLNVDFPDAPLGPLVPYDEAPAGQFALAQQLNSYEYTQELKWTGKLGDYLTYTAGFYYLYEFNKDNFGAAGNVAGSIPGFPLTNLTVPFGDEFTRNDTDSKAVFAQADYKVTDALTITVGARFTDENKSIVNEPLTPGLGFTNADLIANGYETKLSTDQFTPHFSVQYQLTPDLMVYASATRGFQGGGWNGLAFSGSTFNNFGPETLWSYEAGAKYETDDHRLRFNSTFFYEDVQHYQLLGDVPGTTNFVTNNAADIIAYGLESDITWRPIDPLTLSANIGLLNAYYQNPAPIIVAQQALCKASPGPQNDSCGGGIVTYAGLLAPPADAPPVTFSFTASYDWQFNGFSLTPTAGLQWFARHNVSTQGVPEGIQSEYYLLDMGIVFQMENAPWRITAECKNCTGNDYATTDVFGYRYLNNPGTWDLKVNYRF